MNKKVSVDVRESPKLFGKLIKYLSGDVLDSLVSSYTVYYKHDASNLALVERAGNTYYIHVPNRTSFLNDSEVSHSFLKEITIPEDGLTLVDYHIRRRIAQFNPPETGRGKEVSDIDWSLFPSTPPYGTLKTIAIVWEYNSTNMYIMDNETLALAKLVYIQQLEKFSSNDNEVALSLLGLEAIQELTMSLQLPSLPRSSIEDIIKSGYTPFRKLVRLRSNTLTELKKLEEDFFKESKTTVVDISERETIYISLEDLKLLVNGDALPVSGDPDYQNRLEVVEPPNNIARIAYTYGVLYIYVKRGIKKPSKSTLYNLLELEKPVTMNVQSIK